MISTSDVVSSPILTGRFSRLSSWAMKQTFCPFADFDRYKWNGEHVVRLGQG